MNPWPAFIQERLDMWDRLKREQDEMLAAKKPEPIKVCSNFFVLNTIFLVVSLK